MNLGRFKNFLSKETCDYLIEYYRNHLSQSYTYHFTSPMNILECEDSMVSESLKKVIEKCNSFSKVCVDNAEIIRWLNGGHMPPHIDVGDKYAAIVYLNDNYEGGELMIKDMKIKPKAGELIIFENAEMVHSVNTVVGERFTLSSWYKTI
jgi:hypothetical protein